MPILLLNIAIEHVWAISTCCLVFGNLFQTIRIWITCNGCDKLICTMLIIAGAPFVVIR